MNCNNCGSSLNKGDKFCKVCGSLVSPDPSKCFECGSKVSETDKFCKSCGYRLNHNSNQDIDDYVNDIENEELDFDDFDEEDIRDFDYRISYDDLYKENPKFSNKGIFSSILGSFAKQESKKSDRGRDTYRQSSENIKTNKKPIKEEQKTIKEDFTSELPDLSKLEDPIDTRRKLSENKKKLLEESLEKAGDNENFILGEQSESDLMQTQKIDLSEIQRLETEIRKVKVKEEKEKEEEKKKKIQSEKKIQKQAKKNKKKSFWSKEENQSSKGNVKLANFIIPILLCLALVFASGAYLTSKTSKNAVIENLENAVASEDYAKTSAIILRSDEKQIEEHEIKSFIRLMNENDVYRSSLMGAIKEDAIKIGRDANYQSNRVYRLEKVGRKYLFFNDYRVLLDPVTTSLVNGEESTYTFAEREFTSSSDEIILLPGIYRLSHGEESFDVNVSNTNSNFESGVLIIDINDLDFILIEKEEVEEDSADNESENEKTDLAGDVSLTLESPEKARVYINGEDTGLSVKEFNLLDGVNIKDGDKIQVKEEFPWGSAFSDEYIYEGENSIYLEAELNSEDNMQFVMDKVIQLLKEDEEARQTMSMDPFTSLIEPELSSAESLIDSEVNSDIVYYRNYKTMAFDPESFDIYSNDDGSYTAYIGGTVTYETTEISPDEIDSVDADEISEIRGFHLTYLPEKDWFVNLWGYTERYISTDNLIEITVD